MAQFNLICHGMMLFVEGGSGLDILVPAIDVHDVRLGAPGGAECLPFPPSLPDGHYQLSGISSKGKGLGDLNPSYHLLLRADKFRILRQERISISVPTPSRIRLFRAVRPDTGSTADVIFGNVPRNTALGEPNVIHDVVALLYDDVPDGTTVRIGNVRTDVVHDGAPTNVCLYSQVGPGAVPEDPGAPMRHETGVNSLLEFRAGGQPDFMLSKVGDAEKVTGSVGDGIDRCCLFSLFELAHFTTDGTGCSSAFVLGGG